MSRRLFLFILIPTLAIFLSQNQAFSATSSVEFQLKGVLISPSSRSALVNGEVVREGERVSGIEILAIEEAVVRVLSGTEEYAVPVGSGAWLLPSVERPVRSVQAERSSAAPVRTVRSGDTLSAIAEDYAGDGASLYQVMVALFKANPQAFDGNINQLHAGAELHIPETLEIQRHKSEVALAEVLHQTETWKAEQVRPVRVTRSPARTEAVPVAVEETLEAIEYGPVRFGETLSEIAVRVSGESVSMNQMMTALFQANPHAFGDSIDLLHEGAVLRVPGVNELDQTATLAANNYSR